MLGKLCFTEWMQTNEISEKNHDLTYAEFLMKWIWNAKDRIWTRRKCGNRIGRIMYIHPSSSELYYLRMLLNIVKGVRNYKEIRTVNGIVHSTFQSTYNALGLLGDD